MPGAREAAQGAGEPAVELGAAGVAVREVGVSAAMRNELIRHKSSSAAEWPGIAWVPPAGFEHAHMASEAAIAI